MMPSSSGPPHVGDLATARLLVQRLEDLPSLPPLSFPQRLLVSPGARRAVPVTAAVALKRVKSEVRWRRAADERAAARAAMEFLLGASSRAGEVEALARRHLVYNAERVELELRPELGPNFPVVNVDVLHAMRENGGGLVHFMHHGPYVHMTGALKAVGVSGYVAIARFMFDQPRAGLIGYKDRIRLRSLMSGLSLFSAEDSLNAIPPLLGSGELVALASDLPGRLQTSFLGRRVGVASTLAWLGVATGKPVACVSFRRRRRGFPEVVVHPPLDPRSFGDAAELQNAIFAIHEPAVLDWPEALDSPLTRWRDLTVSI